MKTQREDRHIDDSTRSWQAMSNRANYITDIMELGGFWPAFAIERENQAKSGMREHAVRARAELAVRRGRS